MQPGPGPQAPGCAEDGRRLCAGQRSPPVASGGPSSEPLGHLHSAVPWPCCMGTAERPTHVSGHRAQEPLYSWTPKLGEISSMSHFLSWMLRASEEGKVGGDREQWAGFFQGHTEQFLCNLLFSHFYFSPESECLPSWLKWEKTMWWARKINYQEQTEINDYITV